MNFTLTKQEKTAEVYDCLKKKKKFMLQKEIQQNKFGKAKRDGHVLYT